MPDTLEARLREAARTLPDSPTPHLDVRALAKRAFGFDDAGLIVAGASAPDPALWAKFESLLDRRKTGEPVSQILGEKEFYGLVFRLAPGVLTPRPDTETIVDAVVQRRSRDDALRILDLGTGTGCILGALLSVFERARGVGVDVNPAAAALARGNLAALGFSARADILGGDFSTAPPGPFDVIVSNPPYIPDAEASSLPKDVAAFEDPRALYGGADGLRAYQAVIDVARSRLASEGLLVLELGAGQEDAVRALAAVAFPNARIGTDPDLAGRPRAMALEPSRQKNI